MNISSYNKKCDKKTKSGLRRQTVKQIEFAGKKSGRQTVKQIEFAGKNWEIQNKEHFRFFLRKAESRVRNKDAKKDSANQSLNPFFHC